MNINVELTEAAREGDIEKVRTLLAAGADVNTDLGAPLRLASYYGRTEVVRALIQAGAHVVLSSYLKCEEHAIWWACREGHVEVVRVLLEAGADVHASNDSALQWASRKGHTEIVLLLIAYGADASVL